MLQVPSGPRWYVLGASFAAAAALAPYSTLRDDCRWYHDLYWRAREMRMLAAVAIHSPAVWAWMSHDSPAVILGASAAVISVVVLRLEWMRRDVGRPLGAQPSAGRTLRRWGRAWRRTTRKRHHERGWGA
jgi:hypothetical protein